MITRELTIANKTGLHARPAALWVQAASQYKSNIRLKKDDKEVDGKSLLSLLSLGLAAGSKVRLIVDGTDESAAADALEKLITDLEGKGE